jgi:hypothetical protein
MKKKITTKKKQSISKSNAAFEKLSPKNKRITIAKDVIAQLKSGYLNALSSNAYVGIDADNISSEFYGESDNELELKDVFDNEEQCTVCGIGSLFVCAVKRMDKLKVSKLDGGGVSQSLVHEYLKGFFSILQLNAIENAFENYGSPGGNYFDSIQEYLDTCNDPDNERLKLIMENIVKHDGEFKFSKNYCPRMQLITP